MAKSDKKSRSRIQKFINYTKEAFFWPFHLAGMGILFAGMLLAIALSPATLNPFIWITIFAGLEFMFLGGISRNERFIRAINAKYQKDIDAFYKTKTLVEYYNTLNLESQQRFDRLRKQLEGIRESYKKVNSTMPDLINRFLLKLSAIETSYARLLYFKDKFPENSHEQIVLQIDGEIEKIRGEMSGVSERIKQIKAKRMHLLQKRKENFAKLEENRAVIEEQLQTIEEMVGYIKDQPMTLQNTEQEDMMIDNLLFATEQTQESLEEIESMMQSEFYPEFVSDEKLNADMNDSWTDERLKE